ncbi:MAG TPA: UvrD-helicase domain-containing protein [Egibacteraceae bacterium]|nr:UvrD-helicase domain-containing protein [Egibacteraceae bacterium]
MTAGGLADADARARIREDLDATLFVEAGAGTGKTTVLVDRILGLITTGRAELREIAAITFTEAAAAELRDRIQAALERCARDPATAEQEAVRCRVALGQLDETAISTLHSFAQLVLSDHALEAGLPPGFAVLDQTAAQLALGARWEVFADELLAEEAAQEALLLGLGLGMTLESLRLLAEQLNDHWDRLADVQTLPTASLAPPPIREFVASLLEATQCLPLCDDPADGLSAHLVEMRDLARRLQAAGHPANALRVLRDRSLRSAKGRQENWGGRAAEIREQLKELDQRREQILARAGAGVLTALLPHLCRFVAEAAQARAADGAVEFHDLLVRARNLLRDHPAARASVRRRLSHLLVDEFQDTDPLQFEIAMMLATGEGEAPGDAAVDPGRLFFVGDAKQSIYRFRRADIALHEQARQRFAGGAIQLEQNFRTVRGITDWVNVVFAEMMGRDAADGQAQYHALDPHRPPGPQASAVHILGAPARGRVDEIRDREATELAALLRRIREERWQVSEPSGEWRDARYDDIAVLLPTRAALPHLEQAFEDAGVPYRVESSSLVYASQDVRDLLAVLYSVDDPTDQVALVAALRSPAFACRDDELYEHRTAGGRWDYRAEPVLGEEHPVTAALRRLRRMHAERWWQTVGELVESVVREARLMELAFSHRRPRDIWRRLRFVIDQARAFGEGGGTLRGFLRWVSQQLADGARVTEQVLPDVDDDAVRIMTVHAAKGLEFPITALAGLNAARRARGGPRVAWDDAGTLQARLRKGFETPGFAAVAEREKLQDSYEAVRLLYVAATRARDHLIVSAHCAEGIATDALRLHELSARCPQLWRPVDVPGPSSTSAAVSDLVAGPDPASLSESVAESAPFSESAPTSDSPSPPGMARGVAAGLLTPADRQAWAVTRRRQIAAGARRSTIAATGMAEWLAGEAPAVGSRDELDQERSAGGRGRIGTSIGRAVHAVLQTIDLTTGEGLAATALAQASAEGVPERSAEIQRLAARALRSPAVRDAVASGRWWREVYVAAPAGELLLEGFVDLLYETASGLVVVDYKTDRIVDDADVDAHVDRYRLQGATYALALAQTLGRPVARCEFVFLAAAGQVAQRSLPDLPAAVAELRRSLDGAGARVSRGL